MSDTLMGLYERTKRALGDAGGYEALSDEQRDLFNNALDSLMGTKFEHVDLEETEEAVTAFLDAVSTEPEPLPEEEDPAAKYSLPEEAREDLREALKKPYPEWVRKKAVATILIRASDALDQAGQRELASELDVILRTMEKA